MVQSPRVHWWCLQFTGTAGGITPPEPHAVWWAPLQAVNLQLAFCSHTLHIGRTAGYRQLYTAESSRCNTAAHSAQERQQIQRHSVMNNRSAGREAEWVKHRTWLVHDRKYSRPVLRLQNILIPDQNDRALHAGSGAPCSRVHPPDDSPGQKQ